VAQNQKKRELSGIDLGDSEYSQVETLLVENTDEPSQLQAVEEDGDMIVCFIVSFIIFPSIGNCRI
jgi:hypothetical protein